MHARAVFTLSLASTGFCHLDGFTYALLSSVSTVQSLIDVPPKDCLFVRSSQENPSRIDTAKECMRAAARYSFPNGCAAEQTPEWVLVRVLA
jgi:hypothetical protein